MLGFKPIFLDTKESPLLSKKYGKICHFTLHKYNSLFIAWLFNSKNRYRLWKSDSVNWFNIVITQLCKKGSENWIWI